ncbi:protein FAR1-RELATED SEQUENCE 5-like [Tripterygium wilfordii]|uniref:protein FAR1-RELATED SEQUENCE 5-like n=1 Tax=Tripterygium wilfordii TaxID=458696 RepID=UPI0018F8300F|nr:protein FAR1-RELATED SEQUENCE 5-like [Tripterygium wilfordii]
MGSSSSNDGNYVPQVRFEQIPQIGQEFESLDEAHNFYNEYAREAGFSTRLWSTKKNNSGEIIRREMVCYKQSSRKKVELNNVRTRKRGITREGCNVKICFIKSESNKKFIVSIFFEAHNHVLTTPRKVHLLRSHRSMSSAKKDLTQQLSAANVSISQQIGIFEVEAGGIENVGCIEKDFYNARRDEVKMYAGHDAQMLYEYFESQKARNPEYYFAINMDPENKITHCFWEDVECKKAYQVFGDVVVFDTTYNTNRYGMIFVPFVGVNHHGQTILFACAFLSDETTESFLWLLKQFLSCMQEGPPKMIITDQYPAMGKAIAEVLPNIVHRFCMWHILNKFSEKLDAVKWRDNYPSFHKCKWNSSSPEEFEFGWAEVVDQSGLSSNAWLKSVYDIRFMWIPAYVNDTFFVGMSSSQRVENCHAFFKSYVSKKNTLMDFVVRFTRALKHQRHQELMLDHKD